jgi:hypothetical protein
MDRSTSCALMAAKGTVAGAIVPGAISRSDRAAFIECDELGVEATYRETNPYVVALSIHLPTSTRPHCLGSAARIVRGAALTAASNRILLRRPRQREPVRMPGVESKGTSATADISYAPGWYR